MSTFTAPSTAQLTSPQLSDSAAVRFLQRATFGPRSGDVEQLQAMGVDQWLQDQLSRQPVGTHLQRRIDHGDTIGSIWESFLSAPDQLRKRFAYALSQIFVVSGSTVGTERQAHFADLLEAHCFGTYRNLLEQVTRSQAMGQYLTYEYNQKQDDQLAPCPTRTTPERSSSCSASGFGN